MAKRLEHRAVRAAVWALVALIGATALVRWDIAQRREAFQAQARTAHRLISQASARIDAVLATLVLVAEPRRTAGADAQTKDPGTAARLPAVHPELLAVWQREAAPGSAWSGGPDAALVAAEGQARDRAVLASVDAAQGHYTVVRAGEHRSFAAQVDARRLIATGDWPWPADAALVLALERGDERLVLHDASGLPTRAAGLTEGFVFEKAVDSPGQPFRFTARETTGPAQWPWAALAGWALLVGVGFVLAERLRQARRQRERSETLARMAQVGRLNTLGELAGGLAHEINQPLAAVLAGTQAALRRLRDPQRDADDEAAALQALELSVAQARRAAEVVVRLRQRLQQAGPGPAQAVSLPERARHLLALMAADLEPQHIRCTLQVEGDPPAAWADPVAVEQILHNLLLNAAQALQAVPAARRRLALRIEGDARRVRCTVHDHGPGIRPDLLPRLFEPFVSGRPQGLGLGLTLCQSLAAAMDGRLVRDAQATPGTAFTLELPSAAASSGGAPPPRPSAPAADTR